MCKPKHVTIQDGGKVIKELALFWNGHSSRYGIKIGHNHYRMITRKRFYEIINDAREKGYDVYDYTDFD